MAWEIEKVSDEPNDLAKIFRQNTDSDTCLRLTAYYKMQREMSWKRNGSVFQHNLQGTERVKGLLDLKENILAWPLHLLEDSQSKKGH